MSALGQNLTLEVVGESVAKGQKQKSRLALPRVGRLMTADLRKRPSKSY